jgi:hypothetical protein
VKKNFSRLFVTLVVSLLFIGCMENPDSLQSVKVTLFVQLSNYSTERAVFWTYDNSKKTTVSVSSTYARQDGTFSTDPLKGKLVHIFVKGESSMKDFDAECQYTVPLSEFAQEQQCSAEFTWDGKTLVNNQVGIE